ncbi:MAG TPA: DUF1127 domain-containing protein [Candidatus Sulfotelmatobacter sp.]|nr:DUF1127 domain-containing protein [Candidatus Sulfotelmatobacter sp.]
MVSITATDGRRRRLPAHPTVRVVGGMLARLRGWQVRARQRREIAALTERDLRDIGLTRAQLQSELGKPFWRA